MIGVQIQNVGRDVRGLKKRAITTLTFRKMSKQSVRVSKVLVRVGAKEQEPLSRTENRLVIEGTSSEKAVTAGRKVPNFLFDDTRQKKVRVQIYPGESTDSITSKIEDAACAPDRINSRSKTKAVAAVTDLIILPRSMQFSPTKSTKKQQHQGTNDVQYSLPDFISLSCYLPHLRVIEMRQLSLRQFPDGILAFCGTLKVLSLGGYTLFLYS